MQIKEGSTKNEPLAPEIFEYSIGTLIYQWAEKVDDTPDSFFSIWAIIATTDFKVLFPKILLTSRSQRAEVQYNESKEPVSQWSEKSIPITMWREDDKLYCFLLLFTKLGEPIGERQIVYITLQDLAFLDAQNVFMHIFRDPTREKTVGVHGFFVQNTRRIGI
jgi:hypothetical protein